MSLPPAPCRPSASVEIAYASPGASTIGIGSMDDPVQQRQVTIPLNTPTDFTLTDLDGATGPFMVITNDVRVLSPAITDGNTLVVNGPAPESATNNPVNMVPTVVPAVVGTAIKPKVFVGTGKKGKIMLSLLAPASERTVIHFKLMGQAVNHEDYTLKNYKAVVNAGETDFVVKIKPRNVDFGPGQAGKKVKLLIQPGAGYVVGTAVPIKVKEE